MNRQNPNNMTKQTGMSIIELMVASLIGVILLAGLVTLFINNKRTYLEVEQMGRMQENLRFSMQTMFNDIRLANYKGCRHDADLPDTDGDGEPDDAVNGQEGGGTASDEFTVRHISPRDYGTYAGGTTQFELDQPHQLQDGDLIVIQNCNAIEGHQIQAINTDTPSAGTDTIVLATTPSADVNGGTIHRYLSARYHILNDSLARDGTELIDGIENMQILYGEDTVGNDARADTYVAADSVTDWDRVVSMKVALLVATEEYGTQLDTSTYDLLGTTIDPADDLRHRRVTSATAQMRNRLTPF